MDVIPAGCARPPPPRPTGTRRQPPPAERGCARSELAPGCTFFEVRCSRVGEGRVRAHFLRFVAEKGSPAGRGRRPSARAHGKSAGRSNDYPTSRHSKRTRTGRKGRNGGARMQRTSKNVHETRFFRRASAPSGDAWRFRYARSLFDARAGRTQPQPAASRTKPAPIAAGRGRPLPACRLREQQSSNPQARRFVEVS